jgi:hypothetical protein
MGTLFQKSIGQIYSGERLVTKPLPAHRYHLQDHAKLPLRRSFLFVVSGSSPPRNPTTQGVPTGRGGSTFRRDAQTGRLGFR